MLVSAAAEHAHAADRFAREIGAISAIVCGALAAADAQSVGWPAGVVVGVSAWPFRRCALSPLPRPPHRAAPPTPYPTTPRRASPPVTPRGLQAGAGVSMVKRP